MFHVSWFVGPQTAHGMSIISPTISQVKGWLGFHAAGGLDEVDRRIDGSRVENDPMLLTASASPFI
jgi:hypothetical protein